MSVAGGLPLSTFRVLEIASDIAGPYAGKLLVDAGADVVKVEPATGDPLRYWTATGATPTGDSAAFTFLNGSKRSVTGEPDCPDVLELARAADIVLIDQGVSDGALEQLRASCPKVVVSVTPYGRCGPSAHEPATEFTLQARCGSTAGRGLPESRPLSAGGRLGEFIGGVYAAATGLAYAGKARVSGRREFVDVSLLEAMVITMGGLTAVSAQLLGSGASSPRSLELPSIEPTADGYVGFCTITAQQFQDFLALIERFDWLDDAELATFAGRQRRREEFNAAVRQWTSTRTTAEIVEAASALRIPVAPIGTPETIPGMDQFVERGVFVSNPAGFLQPRPPYRISGVGVRSPSLAPAIGADIGLVHWPLENENPPAPGALESTADAPLSGLRIMDLTAFWAGPSATAVLAALGADVVKVEGVKRPDGLRYAGGWPPSREGWWETGPMFLAVNENKRGLSLEMTTAEGQALARRLAGQCDIVIENFSPRVMGNLGLDWEAVSGANPTALMVRMPAFGLDGPWRDRVGFAQTMEQVSGLAWMTGEADGPPVIPRGACDPIAGLHAAFAVLVALEHRHRTGDGALVEVTMVEAALNVAAIGVIEQTAYGRSLSREGNRGPAASPQGVYRCEGSDEWVAIAVTTDEQWEALVAVTGVPELRGAHLQTRADRAADDHIDAALGGWTVARSAQAAANALLPAGVPAAVVTPARDLLRDPQLAYRGFFETIDHPIAGRLAMPGQPMRLSDVEHRWITAAAPTLGEHNALVLGELLGVGPDELTRLQKAHVVGTRPRGL